MKYLLEFVLGDTKEVYLYDADLNDPTSKQLSGNFITNLLSLESNKTSGPHMIFDNIQLNFTTSEFYKFLNCDDGADLIYIYDFFGKNEQVTAILTKILSGSTISVCEILNKNPKYFYNLMSSQGIQHPKVFYSNNSFRKKKFDSVVRRNKKLLRTKIY